MRLTRGEEVFSVSDHADAVEFIAEWWEEGSEGMEYPGGEAWEYSTQTLVRPDGKVLFYDEEEKEGETRIVFYEADVISWR